MLEWFPKRTWLVTVQHRKFRGPGRRGTSFTAPRGQGFVNGGWLLGCGDRTMPGKPLMTGNGPYHLFKWWYVGIVWEHVLTTLLDSLTEHDRLDVAWCNWPGELGIWIRSLKGACRVRWAMITWISGCRFLNSRMIFFVWQILTPWTRNQKSELARSGIY